VTPEAALRLAIDGAVCWVDAADPDAIAAALDAVLAPGAPPLREQRRRARVAALEALARSSSGQRAAPSTATRVHLTRLEHRPVRPEPSEPRPAPPLPCTARQRELLDAIVREGSVGRAAAARGTSRSSVYAALRRIARRLQLRDTAEVLRAIGVHDAGEYRSQLESARS
jgi:DNA-binding NarL/FixJ family response regulator